MCEYCKAKNEIGNLLRGMCKYCKAKTEVMNIIDEKGKKSRSTEISQIPKIGETRTIDILIMQMEELELMIKKLESTILDLKIEILTELI